MPDPNELNPGEPFEATGSWRPASGTRGSDRPGGGSSVRRPPAVADLPATGERLGPFLLQEAIGAGGMGAVYRALDLRLDRDIALKLLPPVQAQDPETVQRFYQEARSAARLDHENIARVYSIGHDGPYHFIAFEYIEGQTIRQRVTETGPLTPAEAVNFTLQIATALVHAADRGVVHRDIKPSNIIVTTKGRAKLVDMGLARRHERDRKGDDLTQSGMTLGTFDYISPEQARDPRDVDVRSDLYSLGCTLFHMLTGRPPFPEGTVLQKLMQHQGDRPPDVLTLNPEVPPELATILGRLMVKDRDRRYQTPDQLVRDLLALANLLGLRSTSPEGLAWLAPPVAEPWQRHLVWGLPSVALALIVAMLVWWGQPVEPAPGFETSQAALPNPPRKNAMARSGREPRENERQADPTANPTRVAIEGTIPTPPPATIAPEPAPTSVTLVSGDDLMKALARAPAGAVITLADAGPFDLPWSPSGSTLGRSGALDVTVRAAPGARPVIRSRPATGTLGSDLAMLPLTGGRVVLEGLEFRAQTGGIEASLSAIAARDVDLTLTRCVFRQEGASARSRSTCLVRLIGSSQERPSPTRLDACLFAGSVPSVRVEGDADLVGRDLGFGLATPAVTVVGDDLGDPPRVRLHLSHASILMADGPAFRLGRAAVSLRLDDSIVAPAPGRTGGLIAAADPSLLDWLGRGNLYGRLDPFLDPPADSTGVGPIRSFAAWEEDARRVRELDSVATVGPTWASPDPSSLLSGLEPGTAFLVDPAERPGPESGLRNGPTGPLRAEPTQVASLSPATSPAPTATNNGDGTGAAAREPVAEPVEPTEVLPAPMIVAGAEIEGPSPGVSPSGTTAVAEPGAPIPDVAPAPIVNGPALAHETAAVARATDLQGILRRATAPSEPIRIEAGADLVLATADLSASGRWVIQGAAGTGTGVGAAGRPRLRFRPQITDEPDPIAWMSLFRLPAGGLELQDLDIVLDPAEVPSGCRLAGFVLGPGAELTLTRCTITLIGPAPRSAVMVIEAAPGATRDGPPGAEAMTTVVRAQDSVLRAGADLIDVGGGGRFEAQISNTVMAASGSLLRGHGSVAQAFDPRPLKLDLRRVAARLAGGLAQLDSEPGEPVLPQIEVVARDSLFATVGRNAPLFRVDGQNDLDELRDRVRWEGHGVAYHQIDVYRRDQSSRPGTVPLPFRRSDWEVAIGPREDDPFHGEVRFATPWPEARSPWTITPGDFRLDPRSPAQSSLPDLALVPEPPPLASP
jgi:serine/threonine-protein kinase